MLEDLAFFGAPDSVMEEVRADVSAEDEPLEVFEEHREVVELFVASGTQWRYAGLEALPAGLDYAGVRATAEAIGTPWERRLLDSLRVMEHAAIEALAERRPKRDSTKTGVRAHGTTRSPLADGRTRPSPSARGRRRSAVGDKSGG